MPNLFTRRARLRWLEMQREKAREAWERLGRLYIGLCGSTTGRAGSAPDADRHSND